MIELLSLSIGTPLAYLWIAWRTAIPIYRKHRAGSQRYYGSDGGCLCSDNGDAAGVAIVSALFWPLAGLWMAIQAGAFGIMHALDHAADKTPRVRSYMRYVPFLCDRHHAARDTRIKELERELGR